MCSCTTRMLRISFSLSHSEFLAFFVFFYFVFSQISQTFYFEMRNDFLFSIQLELLKYEVFSTDIKYQREEWKMGESSSVNE